MRIASFDIGIKHLAFCILDIDANNSHSIYKWNVINVLEDSQNFCEMINNKEKKCEKVASIIANGKYCCDKKTCIKSFDLLYPISQHPRSQLKKSKPVIKEPLFSLCTSIKRVLDNYIDDIKSCDIVVLENQPVLKNPTMKSVQMFIYSHCLINGAKNIALFNANKKLDIYDGPEIDSKGKSGYTLRKYLSVEYTRFFLKRDNSLWIDYFEKNKKMDDLADCYLQGLTYHKSMNKKKK
jgi:hypothetical protein